MKRLLKVFMFTPRTRPLLVAACLVVSGITQAIGIGTFLPLISTFTPGNQNKSQIAGILNRAFAFVGLTPTTNALILLAVGLLVVKSIIAFAALAYAGVTAANVSINFRQRLISQVFEAEWRFFGGQRGGHFASIISSDAGRAGDAYLFSAQVVAALCEALASCAVAFLIDWRLTLFGILASVTLALTMRRVIRASRRAGYHQTDRTQELTVFIVDLLANIKPLKAMHAFQPITGKVNVLLGRLKKAVVTREIAKAGLAEGNDALIAIFFGSAIYFATRLSNIALPELAVSGVIFVQLVSLAGRLQKLMQQFATVESAYLRTEDFVRTIGDNRENLAGTAIPQPGAPVVFQNVSFSHGDHQVIENASFEILPSSLTVLYGPSGSGKTTLIDLLIGLYRPVKGQIVVGEVPLSEVDIRSWRSMIGYVPQELNLFHSSIRDNITLGDLTVPDEVVLAAITKAGASDFVARLPLGIHTDVGELGSKISGGQRQRISLARALLRDPRILILDEVTSALDPATEADIVANIRSLASNYTIIAITHRPAWTRVADRLYKVADGNVALVRNAAIS